MKAQVVDLLTAMGLAMKRRGDLRRSRAYMRAANSIARTEAFEQLLAEDRLRDIGGVGPSIERLVKDFAETGEWPEWLRQEEPIEPGELDEVPEVPRAYQDAPFPGLPDLHVHTTWSDGSLTLDEVVSLAKRLGAPAIGISDHSGSLRVARGLKPHEVLQQWEDIARAQAAHPDILILRGTECDILRDGTLDHPEHILTGFDYVIGSLHSHLRLPEPEQTERLLAALESPYLTAVGHPTTAVPGYRPPANIDLDQVFEKAADEGVAMEVNGNPGRLDLSVDLARRALRAGCKLCLGSDGHSGREMLAFAVARRMAREAGADEEDLVNARLLHAARRKLGRRVAR